MQVTIVGGTGLVGQGIIQELVKIPGYKVYSLSRHGKRYDSQLGATYYAGSFDDERWQELIKSSDWVIDCVGILRENLFKGQTYQNTIIEPANRIAELMKSGENKLLFVSANYAPKSLARYLTAKKLAEQLLKTKLSHRVTILYPGLIYDRQRQSTYYLGRALALVKKWPGFAKIRPIARNDFAKEVVAIISRNKKSSLQIRRV